MRASTTTRTSRRWTPRSRVPLGPPAQGTGPLRHHPHGLAGDPTDPGARAGLGAPRADVQIQAHEEAAPEAADGSGEQAEGRDGRTSAEARQRAGDAEEQLQQRSRQTRQEEPGHPGERGECRITTIDGWIDGKNDRKEKSE